MKPIIEVHNLSKKYYYGQSVQPYYTLRDTLTGIMKSPGQVVAKTMKKKLDRNEFWALKDVSFEVKEGEVLGIIGSNGAGKSTLLKILSRITPPTEGKAVLGGRVGSLLEVGTGFHPELTGEENLYLNGAILGMKRKEIVKKYDQIVEFSGVGDFMQTPVKRYSSGMFVRLAFAVAAHLEPEILLIDEVLAVGDAEFQRRCLQKMDNITSEDKRTILFVSHNMAAIKNLCKRCLVLGEGEIKYYGDTDKAISYYLKSSQSMGKIPLVKRRDREGNGLLIITSINIPQTCVSGKLAVFELNYKSRLPDVRQNISIELRVKSMLGEPLFSLNNKYTGENFEKPGKKGKFVCKIPRLPLDVGEYRIDLRCKVNKQVTDKIDNVIKFKVESGDFFGSGVSIDKGRGYILVDQKWEIIKIN